MHRDTSSKRLGLNLKKLRLKKKMSQGDISRKLGVDRAYISSIENGRMNPTLTTLEKLAEAIGVNSSELLK
jgi:transcriptional regulator with XRE-family HTH domain